MGYLGSVAGLLLGLAFVSNLKLVWLSVVAFFAVFSIPTFLVLPRDVPGEMTMRRAARWGLVRRTRPRMLRTSNRTAR